MMKVADSFPGPFQEREKEIWEIIELLRISNFNQNIHDEDRRSQVLKDGDGDIVCLQAAKSFAYPIQSRHILKRYKSLENA